MKSTLLPLLLCASLSAPAQSVHYTCDPSTGAISRLTLSGDRNNMNWVLTPDGRQYAWVGAQQGWGLGRYIYI